LNPSGKSGDEPYFIIVTAQVISLKAESWKRVLTFELGSTNVIREKMKNIRME